jgi:hypothetical protein
MRRIGIPDAKAPKYGNRKTVLDGITFDSAKEAKRWAELKLLEREGGIDCLQRQVPIELHGQLGFIRTKTGRIMTYVADFTYTDKRAREVIIEDAKGFQTPEYKLKRAILAAMGITIREV